MSAVLSMLQFSRSLPIFLEPLLRNQYINVIPRQTFVKLSLTELKCNIIFKFFNRLIPSTHIEMFIPSLKPSSLFKGSLNQVTRTTVSSRNKPLQKGLVGIVATKLNRRMLPNLCKKNLLSTLCFSTINLWCPLERSERLRNKSRHPVFTLATIDLSTHVQCFNVKSAMVSTSSSLQ